MKLRLSVIALLGFAAPLLAMDVPKKDTFLLTVHNKTDRQILVAPFEREEKSWGAAIAGEMIAGRSFVINPVDKQVLRVDAGQTAEKEMKHYKPETFFVIQEGGKQFSGYADKDLYKVFPENADLRDIKHRVKIVADHVVLTASPGQPVHGAPWQPDTKFEQLNYSPDFSLDIENNTNDPYYTRVFSQVSKKGWLGATTALQPLSPVHKIEPHAKVEVEKTLPKRSAAAGSQDQLIFAIARSEGDFADSQK